MLEPKAAGLLLWEVDVALTKLIGDRGLVVAQFLADVFEARESFYTTEAKFFRDRFLQIRRDECLDNHSARMIAGIEDALFKKLHRAIPSQDRANLVACDELHVAFGVAGSDAHAVIIRVGRNHEVRTSSVSLRDRHAESLGVFGVGRLDGGEATIGHFLFRHALTLESQTLEHWLNNNAAHAMQWGVNDLERILSADQIRVQRECGQARHVGFVDIHPHRDHAPALTFRNGRVVFALDGVHFFDDGRGMRLDDLATVLEVHFVAIIFRRVVAGGEVDAGLGFDVADGERKLGSRSRTLKQIGVATEFGDDFGR